MEYGINDDIPIFAGGLGILAGDTLKSACDLGIPMIGVTNLYKHGYCKQSLESGWQKEEYPAIDLKRIGESYIVKELPNIIRIGIEGRQVAVGGVLFEFRNEEERSPHRGHAVHLLALTTDLPENPTEDRRITNYLYAGDFEKRSERRMRLLQEIVLGVGGVRMLQAMGTSPQVYHLNEGHGAFVPIELLRQGLTLEDVRDRTVFTTHTPVSAGHDSFDYHLIDSVLGPHIPSNLRWTLPSIGGQNEFNTTRVALNTSRYANGVSRRHAEVTRRMFPYRRIDSITNGVHARTWTSPHLQLLFDKHLDGWRDNPERLLEAERIPTGELLEAHASAQKQLFAYIKERTNVGFDLDLITVGFARRAAEYKRGDLLFHNIDRLLDIGGGRIQLVYAGKAHPWDDRGKRIINRIHSIAQHVRDQRNERIKLVYLENYSMEIGKLLTGGCDVWLNSPVRGLEASGTSGMKAAHNGVPQLSTLDGWWCEGRHQGGWSFGAEPNERDPVLTETDEDARALYETLERDVLPTYANEESFAAIMRGAIRNAAFFNTHRMLREYAEKAYRL